MKCTLIRVLGLVSVLTAPSVRASDFFTSDVYNFASLYEGNGHNTLNYNNSTLTGNVGIGCGTAVCSSTTTGQFQGTSGTITGTVEFAASQSTPTQYQTSGTYSASGGATFSNANVTADLTSINTVSQTLGGETGTSLAFDSGDSVNLNSCTVSTCTLDGSGNYVFTLSSVSFPNGTFTITGDGTHNVVFNVPSSLGGVAFNGNIVLVGGINQDQVLFNLTGGDYSTESGGQTLTISTSGLTTTGIFLDVNGDFQINHSTLDGRIFGGDTHNVSIVSGASIDDSGGNGTTQGGQVPEPTSVVLLGSVVFITGVALRKKLSRA